MLRPQIMGLFLTLAGSGCSTLTPSTALYWESMQAPADDIDSDQFHRSKLDQEAKQLSQEGLKTGLKVHVLLVDRQIKEEGKNPEVRLHVTQYLGMVQSVDGQTVVLKDAIQIIEGRSMHSVPVLSKVPYVDMTPEPIELPPRLGGGDYQRPPLNEQFFVPNCYP